jgi:hypothetical protein
LVVHSSFENQTYEIPFVKEFVEHIQFNNKEILMNLPEGILNFQLNDYDNHDGSQNQNRTTDDEN